MHSSGDEARTPDPPDVQPPWGLWKAQGSFSSLTCELSCGHQAVCLQMGLALSTKKVVREDTQPRAVRWPDVPDLECLSFLPSFPFLFFGGFNLKPPHNTQHKEKKKCKNLCVQGHRGLYPWCSITLSEALPAQSWDLVDPRMDGAEEPWPGIARSSLV